MHAEHPAFQAPSPSLEARVSELVAQLTLSEKILLLAGQPGRGATHPIPRLGIPEFKMSDGPMGVHWWCSVATAYPALFLAAASFDRELWLKLGESLGRDARARGVHILLAPGVNLYRSPLCGRNFEYAGEDPFLAGEVGAGFIRGVQSQGVAATVKHFACNFQEYDRHNVSTDLDRTTLFSMYLPAFEKAVREAGVGAVMTAYNLVNGVHCAEHPELIAEILKQRWGFDGIVMSDWVSVYSTEKTALAGLDLEMPTAEWFTEDKLRPLVESGAVPEEVLDDKVRRLLRLALCFGWLDRDQRDASLGETDPESAAVALQVARRGIVLLKNEQQSLPLDPKQLRRVAVLGANAHPAVHSGGGSAFTKPAAAVSVRDGLQRLLPPSVELVHASGPEPNPQRQVFGTSSFSSRLGAGLTGEYYNNDALAGTPVVTRLDPHLDFTWGPSAPMPEITVEHFSARWSGTITAERSGKHVLYARSHDSVYQVQLDGKVLIDTWPGERNGLHTIGLELTAGEPHALEVVWKKTRYWGGMQLGWECIEARGQAIADCVALAAQADVAVVCVGFDHVSEGEGFDRPFAMQSELIELIQRVVAIQPKTVVVLFSGGNLDMRDWLPQIPALMFVGYPGQEGGQAIAEILLGLENPSGKLPATFERRLEDRSSFDCYHDTAGTKRVNLTDGRITGYRHAELRGQSPMFPFGFGLSYTRFEFTDLECPAVLGSGEPFEVKVRVTNIGARAGREVVQLYVRHPVHGEGPEPKQLAEFAVVQLEPGASVWVPLTLPERAFSAFSQATDDFVLVPGTHEILVGNSAEHNPLSARVEVR